MRTVTLLVLAILALAPPAIAQEANPYDDLVISEDLSALPEPVRARREQLIEATRSGDIETLRAIIDGQATPPRVSFGEPDDAIEHLKDESADGEGLEILAILRKLLDAPYGIIGASSDRPSYVWPYLAAMTDVSALTPAQQVDAYRILTPEQVEDMGELGGWYYWRVFIGADGDWQAFVAGD